jgi:hypothetical protein
MTTLTIAVWKGSPIPFFFDQYILLIAVMVAAVVSGLQTLAGFGPVGFSALGAG